MAEAVFRTGSRKVDGSPLRSASGHGTQVLVGAGEVCESDPAGKEEFRARQS